jgi:nucleoside diphosphate kinase
MILLAKLVAIGFIILGCVVIMKHGLLKKMLDYVEEGNRIYGIAVVRVLFGVIFIMAAVMARAGWIVTAIGWLLILSGVAVFVLKKEKAIELVEKVAGTAKPKKAKFIGTIPVVIGVLLLCAL